MDPASGILMSAGIDPNPGSKKGSGIDPNPGSHSTSGIDPNPGNSSQPVPNGLVMSALNSSRSALSRPDIDHWFALRRRSGRNLWQLEPEWLVTVVQKQLGQRLMVIDRVLWLASAPAPDGSVASPALKLLTIVGPNTDTDIGRKTLEVQTQAVIDRAEERPDRSAEIQVQADNLWPFFSAITYVVPARAPRTAQLLAVATAMASAVAQQFKYQIGCPRPVDCSAAVQPLITTPSHASLPSGHATSAYLMQRVLQELLGLSPNAGAAVAMRRLARRVAENRTVAGLHFPMDSCAGWLLGRTLADVVVAVATHGNLPEDRSFDSADLAFSDEGDPAKGNLPPGDEEFEVVPGCRDAIRTGHARAPIEDVASLWQAAVAELAAQGLRSPGAQA